MSQHILVYMTCESVSEAKRIASALVDSRLIACANILPQMLSVYRWQDAVESSEEVVLIGKTEREYFSAIQKKVTDLHSYDLPCVVALPITEGLPDFLQWVSEEVSK